MPLSLVAPYPLISGSVIHCPPVGMLNMTDDGGPDAKTEIVASIERFKAAPDKPRF